MVIWTTFSPRKVVWEMTTIHGKGKGGSSDWMKHKTIIADSLSLLKASGISGIRVVIFPDELTKDGKKFSWSAVDTMLTLCKKQKLVVDLCIGPFQYPYYPGVYLPSKLREAYNGDNARYRLAPGDARFVIRLRNTFDAKRYVLRYPQTIDDNHLLRNYGLHFLKLQLERYGDDDRIRGFHFANEWPDVQGISGNEELRCSVSKKFMVDAVGIIKKMTKKPISMNTNIDASFGVKIFEIFKDIFAILDTQGKLGFDIYPSQETWRKAPIQKIKRLFERYIISFATVCNMFDPCEIYFAEVEAQPWGDGRSWYEIIKNEQNPHEKVLGYTQDSLKNTWSSYITDTNCQTVSLWGSDFWLSANEMGITWPINAVRELANEITNQKLQIPNKSQLSKY